MPSKVTIGRVLMYIKNGINYVPRNDLEIEKDKNLNPALLKYLTKIAKVL